MKKFLLLSLVCLGMFENSYGNFNDGDGWNEYMTLFKHGTVTATNGFRIPAITSTGNGGLIAVADIRYAGTSGNTDMPNQVGFSIKTSDDGGSTWVDREIILPTKVDPVTGQEKVIGITDPALVFDKSTGTTFLFGYNNDKFITNKPVSQNSDFIVYTSKDNGKTWDNGVSIKDQIKAQLPGYEYVFQGPGGGMNYNGTLYMPIQAWHHKDDNKNGATATSGFIFSTDNGKTWTASVLRPDNISSVDNPDYPDVSGESNVFYHKGEIYLAVRPETGREAKKRVVYKTSDNGKTWTRVEESFIPDNVAHSESSSLSLSEDVYLAGYAMAGANKTREDIYITTNTGKSIKLWEGQTNGYTSMTADEDNLYVLFESKPRESDILMRRFDISSKEYANVNAQLLNRGQRIIDIQEKLHLNNIYIGGEYTSEKENEVEALIDYRGLRIGAFYHRVEDNSKDAYRTIKYDTDEMTLLLSKDSFLFQNDILFGGYQYGKVKYVNGSEMDVYSGIGGYSLAFDFDLLSYYVSLGGAFTRNELQRNYEEGLGRKANFDSYSIGMRNELFKNIELENNKYLKLRGGIDTVFFGHDKIEEEDGLNFNEATVEKSENVSNEIYLEADLSKDKILMENLRSKFGFNVEYRKELMDIEEWKDTFTILDVTKKYESPVKPVREYGDGIGTLETYLSLKFEESFDVKGTFYIDSTGEQGTKLELKYEF